MHFKWSFVHNFSTSFLFSLWQCFRIKTYFHKRSRKRFYRCIQWTSSGIKEEEIFRAASCKQRRTGIQMPYLNFWIFFFISFPLWIPSWIISVLRMQTLQQLYYSSFFLLFIHSKIHIFVTLRVYLHHTGEKSFKVINFIYLLNRSG